MKLSFVRINESDRDKLIRWLTSFTWPFHGRIVYPQNEAAREFDSGRFTSEHVRSFWIEQDGSPAGFVRLFDLEDPTPMFDLRIAPAFRGRGIGTKTVRWLTEYVFTTWPDKTRTEAHTREDNIAMRSVFHRCGYVKEAHRRKAWPDDSVGCQCDRCIVQ